MNPRESFLKKGENAKRFLDILDSQVFKDALEAGALQAALDLPRDGENSQTAMANGFRLDGIRRLVTALESLNMQHQERRPAPKDNLTRI